MDATPEYRRSGCCDYARHARWPHGAVLSSSRSLYRSGGSRTNIFLHYRDYCDLHRPDVDDISESCRPTRRESDGTTRVDFGGSAVRPTDFRRPVPTRRPELVAARGKLDRSRRDAHLDHFSRSIELQGRRPDPQACAADFDSADAPGLPGWCCLLHPRPARTRSPAAATSHGYFHRGSCGRRCATAGNDRDLDHSSLVDRFATSKDWDQTNAELGYHRRRLP